MVAISLSLRFWTVPYLEVGRQINALLSPGDSIRAVYIA